MKRDPRIKRLLIANRGEIAVRIIRAAQSLGIETVAVYSDADLGAAHIRLADQAIALGPGPAKESYLNQERILLAATQSGVDAIHPGYGFFSENPGFASAVSDEGFNYIGPSAKAIAVMAEKDRAREVVSQVGVPLLPGTAAVTAADAESVKMVERFAETIGYPIIAKAVAGGSGRGMRVINDKSEILGKLKEAQQEAQAAFANGAVFVERYLARPRHIEVQLFGDLHGGLIHLGERECSLQRRHQKLVEECPAPNLHPTLRERICNAALAAAGAVNYHGAGTVEFLVEGGEGAEDPFYFLEMNTRIQVEHPVTEEVTGIDLVRLQLLVAQGEPLPVRQQEIQFRGHAIEFRVSAENPAQSFAPVTGEIQYLSRAGGAGVREDGWVESGTKISPYYDSLLLKLIVSGADRFETLGRARAALDEMVIDGLPTTLGFHRWLLTQPAFQQGRVDIKWIEQNYRGEILHPSAVGPLRASKKRRDL